MSDSTFGHDTYLSPFTWRYGSEHMRAIWSEENRRRGLRRVWVALAAAQHRAGLVTTEQLADLRAHQDDIDLARARQIEAQIRHDLMAEVKTFAEQCPVGGGIIHLGATSTDISDNVDALRIRDALGLILSSLRELLEILAFLIDGCAAQPCMAFTHIQPAEPTTIGYRLAQYGQDLLEDFVRLSDLRKRLRGKGIKGAVGTSASYTELLAGTGMTPAELEALVMTELGLEAYPVATQTYPRKQDWEVVTALAGLAGSLHKFALDLRVLQTPPIGEWSEPFGAQQVGSSAMPFKRNPVKSENINSLARIVAAFSAVAWENAAHSLLERTLDDSANRREILPTAFLALDEMLSTARQIAGDLRLNHGAIARNMEIYGTFAATERLLMALVRAGANRQAMHEVIREHSMAAWADIQAGASSTLAARLSGDPRVTSIIDPEQVLALLSADHYVGDAPVRAAAFARRIQETLACHDIL